MKSPEDLRRVLRRQWDHPALRESRLLGIENAWPVLLPIGRPTPSLIQLDFDAVKQHIESWRRITCGEVIWKPISYRATESAIDIPICWKLHKPSEWIDACDEPSVRREFNVLTSLAEQTDVLFHPLFVRKRSLWKENSVTEIVLAARIALTLKPGIAKGRPLRSLSIEGIDTKFFERNERLMTALLDTRFDGEVRSIGLEAFLGAFSETNHWLLVIDLDGSLLPFRSQRVRSSELQTRTLPGKRLLIVENESCQHHLPCVPDTIAVLGAGFDLDWMSNPTFSQKRIGYWGDIDTWGLQFLAKARQTIESLDALMMTSEVFARSNDSAVPEPVIASTEIPAALNPPERELYQQLLQARCGRLEQEFLPQQLIRTAVLNWAGSDLNGD